jgi:NADH:ubiquinone oxidoreductase subunit 6 (subunit J)
MTADQRITGSSEPAEPTPQVVGPATEQVADHVADHVGDPPTEQQAGRRSVTRVLVLCALGVAAGWLAIVVLWRDAPFALTFDDAFYYFGIARNVANGHGSTFDGINPTNGYHPLWMLMAVPVYWAGLDGTAAVRVLLALQVLLYGGALVLVALTAGRMIEGWSRLRERKGAADADRAATWCTALAGMALVLAGGNPFIVKIFVNGLESGVVVLLDATLLWVAVRQRRRWLTRGTSGGRVAIGALLALIVLGRTDSVLLVGALGLWTLTEAKPLGRRALRPLAELFALPAIALALYLVSNQVMFGITMQISGMVKRQPLTIGRVVTMAVVVAIAGAVGWLGWARCTGAGRRGRFRRTGRFASSTSWYAAFCIVLVAYYQVLQTQQWLWYYCPVAIYVLFLLVIGVADFGESAALEAPAGRPIGQALAPVAAILFAPLVVALVIQTRAFVDPHLRSIQMANRDAGEWIDDNLPGTAVLASWDAGAVGYFAGRPVINLDGVANSVEYDDASRNGIVGAFLAERGLTGIVNHGTPMDGRDPEIEAFVRGLWGEETAASAVVVKSWPFRYSGNTVGGAGRAGGQSDLAVFLYSVDPPAAGT